MSAESASASPAPLIDTPSASEEDPGDVDYGWAMFWIFLAAVLAISLAVCVLAMAPSWWLLGVVYGVDLVVTGLVFKVVLGAFTSPGYPSPEGAASAGKAASLESAVVPLKAPRPMMPAHR